MMSDSKLNDDQIVDKIVSKRYDVLIQFKTMNQILNERGAWFDGHGNLCVGGHNVFGESMHLAPSYFHYLGKTIPLKSHHSFPTWCIEREWQDLFAPNMALRAIASGNYDAERMKEIAEKAVLVK